MAEHFDGAQAVRRRGYFVVCCDGLTGFGRAMEAALPNTLVQTCIEHLLRMLSPCRMSPALSLRRPPVTCPHRVAPASPRGGMPAARGPRHQSRKLVRTRE